MGSPKCHPSESIPLNFANLPLSKLGATCPQTFDYRKSLGYDGPGSRFILAPPGNRLDLRTLNHLTVDPSINSTYSEN